MFDNEVVKNLLNEDIMVMQVPIHYRYQLINMSKLDF